MSDFPTTRYDAMGAIRLIAVIDSWCLVRRGSRHPFALSLSNWVQLAPIPVGKVGRRPIATATGLTWVGAPERERLSIIPEAAREPA